MTYKVVIERAAIKSLSRIPSPHRERVAGVIQALSSDPRPPGAKKLSGRDSWRIRVGEYHVIYEISDKVLTVLVVAVGPRRDVYRS